MEMDLDNDDEIQSQHAVAENAAAIAEAARRKSLPAWIREGLERMDKEKAKKEEKEKKLLEYEEEKRKRMEEEKQIEEEIRRENLVGAIMTTTMVTRKWKDVTRREPRRIKTRKERRWKKKIDTTVRK